MKPTHKIFLDILRDSGVTNMFGAATYIQKEFGLSKKESRKILLEWINQY